MIDFLNQPPKELAVPDVYCVRAEYGSYAKQFLAGKYAAIGWFPDTDLTSIKSREELYPLYRAAHPDDTSNIVVGQQVGQIARFLLDVKGGDYLITPDLNTELLHYGIVGSTPSYFYGDTSDGCPFHHRRPVSWAAKPLRRSDLSVPLQNTLRSALTIFLVSQKDEFLAKIGRNELLASPKHSAYDPYRAVLDQILELNAKEFEILITHLLSALGFEGSEHTGKTGDGGVDATGELNIANLARVKVFVQAKRYQIGSKIAASTVRQLRAAIPFGGQGAFITTADFQDDALETAIQPGFPRIGLVNGQQLVDLLIEHWSKIPEEFKKLLALKPGLVRI